MTRTRLTLRGLAAAFGLGRATGRDELAARRADVDRWLDDVPELSPDADRSGPTLRRAQIVALLVPSSPDPEGAFRLRAAPDPQSLPDHVPDGAGRIYRTGDGRIVLDWNRAS